MSPKTQIALIEDNPADAFWFNLTLEEMHLSPTVRVYQHAVSALDAFRTESAPDLIVSDWFLPILEFPDFIKKLRVIRGYEKVPVATFLVLKESMEPEALELGVTYCLTKPVDEEQLRQLFKRVFGYAAAG